MRTEALLSRPQTRPPDVETAAELAACLRRFLSATADEQTMRRAAAALASWEAGPPSAQRLLSKP